jgi:tRNA (guanine10-N2)-dimethyltransferase
MIPQSVFILGRQPAIGRAELESVFGADTLAPVGERAMACALPPNEVNFARLGGSVRLAKPLATLTAAQWNDLVREAAAALPAVIATLPGEGKIKLGVSAIGLTASAKQLFAAGLELKKACKQAGRSARLVPNTEPELGSAQVLHNQLTGDLGVELLLIKNGAKTLLAQTVAVQDINAYARRDQNRPKRDPRVGMLPPKLAQIIVNLAAGKHEPSSKFTVLDPFCGTGVVLQEAIMMGYSAYGSDLETRMVDFSSTNISWLRDEHPELKGLLSLGIGDATSHTWEPKFNAIASEAYLGRPFSAQPKPETLNEVVRDVDTILAKFLQNIARQTQPGVRMCIAVPAWRAGQTFKRLPLVDHLDKLGYNRVSFEHADEQELIYYRPDQIVARELLVITRK